ncbi:MAG TPA: TonB-dependent receptor [Thermoanaerobaculia bacterium]|nr:TonB-dependent receptor [Thermoanaerobaculia bacterium]
MRLAALLLAAGLWLPAAGRGEPPPPPPAFVGLSLTEAIQVLQARGLPVVFSSRVVRASMRVETEPQGETLREILDELLRPHGLKAEERARGRLVVLPAPAARTTTPIDRPLEGEFEDEIVVTPEAQPKPLEAHGVLAITRDEAAELPHLGDDMLRAVEALPGTVRPETSSRIHVRGGRDDEVLILLDGLELLAPYHLQEFDSALSIVAPSALDSAQLITSGYPAEYGDRMGGVIDLTTTTPSARRLTAGVGLLYGELGGAGLFGEERGSWYAAARSGTYRLALELEGGDADPRFWDLFGKVGYQLAPGQSLRLEALVAEDEYGLAAAGPADESYNSRWQNRYLWLAHDALLRPDLQVESIVSVGEVERNRSGRTADELARFEVRDRRTLGIAGIKQTWRLDPRPSFALAGGFELRRLGSSVAYANERELSGPLAPLRTRPAVGSTAFRERFDFDQVGAFVSGEARPSDALTTEIGLRYDSDRLTDERHWSPRFNLAWRARPRSVVRLAWGWYYQSQRPNELQVEDDETELYPAERSEHRVVAVEHELRGGSSLRLEAFERRLSRARPRYENLFDRVFVFPELEEDRVLLDPVRGVSRGVEIAFRSSDRRPLGWEAAYTLSSAEEILGGRSVPRAIDQPHALRAAVRYRLASGWSAQAAWLYHTGWPTTEVSGRAVTDADGTVAIEPVLGPLRGDRLPAYHRLDLRVSRSWELARGRLSAYLDLQNLYDRENARGFDDLDFDLGSDGAVAVRSETLTWGGLLPSFGVRWEM